MERGHYNGYRGNTTARNVLRRLLVLLVVLLLLAVIGLLVGQRYIVYTDDGVRLELPFFQREESASAADVSAPLEIIQRPAPSESAYANGELAEFAE